MQKFYLTLTFECTEEFHVEGNTETTNLYVYVCSLECRMVIITTN